MTPIRWRIDDLTLRQHGAVAGWQLLLEGFSRGQVDAAFRGLRRVHRDVCAFGDLTELGWYAAAALAYGPTAAISHLSALMLLEMRPFRPGDIHVSVLGNGARSRRQGTIFHRRRRMETELRDGIPVTSVAQSLADAPLLPHELYRAHEEAEKRGHRAGGEHARIRRAVRGFTRSDAEARLLLLVADLGWPLPLVNQHLNGFETDFHWPHDRLVVEVDGYEHHRERNAFNRDRFRGLFHEANGWHVVRASADDVRDRPRLVERALRRITGWR